MSKQKTKWFKVVAVLLFLFVFFFNLSISLDQDSAENRDLSLQDLEFNLLEKAYGYDNPIWCYAIFCTGGNHRCYEFDGPGFHIELCGRKSKR